jgi:excinuclease UvrABC nuclease subunit
MSTVILQDPFGVNHGFSVYGISQPLPPFEGIYAVLRLEQATWKYTVLYIGKCQNFRERHQCHHKKLDFLVHGATHIGWHLLPGKQARSDLEAELIHQYRPPLNNVPTLVRSLRR